MSTSGVASSLPEGAHQIERLLQGLPGLEGALGRHLDRRSVGHRVGERHTQFDDVGARRRQRLHEGQRRLGVGVAGGKKRYQRGAACRLQLRKAPIDTRGHG